MKKVRIAELKNHLSRYLDHVRAGGTVVVLDRNEAVAQIVPLGRGAGADDDRLARLERKGLIRRGTGELPDWFPKRKPPRVPGSVLRDLLAQRRASR